MLNSLTSNSPPIVENQVVVTFLNDNYIPHTHIKIGDHKQNTISKSIPVYNYTNITKYNLQNNGFECINFTPIDLIVLKSLYDNSIKLNKNTKVNNNINKKAQPAISHLETYLKTFYEKKFNLQNITVIGSKNVVLRVAGCGKDSCHISGNPLIHLDYFDFKNGYDRQCPDQSKYTNKKNCPPVELLIDILNIWFPTELIQDYPLGFIDKNDVDKSEYIPIELVPGSIAASIKYKSNLRIIYKKNMSVGEAYIFRSATDTTDIVNKKGVFHSSFRITNEQFMRKSVEFRFLIFKQPVLIINNSVPLNIHNGGSYNKKYYKKTQKQLKIKMINIIKKKTKFNKKYKY